MAHTGESGEVPWTAKTPRPEAHAQPYRALTDFERIAYDEAVSLLLGMACTDHPEDEAGRTSEDSPTNTSILIDGGRGAGKTTVLRTLIRDLATLSAPSDCAPQAPASPVDRQQRAHLDRLARAFGDVSLEVLPTLDLQPLPGNTSLFVHVAARLIRKPPPASAPWRPGAEAVEPLRAAWQDFLRDAAVGWEFSLAARTDLDAESYALEVERTAESWRNVGHSFHKLVNALCRETLERRGRSGTRRRPLFVLPIDDADMNPARSVEVLELLRALSHPRLVFLLTGHADLFDVQLRAGFLAKLRGGLRGIPVADEELFATVPRQTAIRLAQEFFERVIPSDHRCVIPRYGAQRRLEAWPDLLALFREMKFADGSFSVADVLRDNGLLGEALPDRLRALIDLERRIRHDVTRAPRDREGATPGESMRELEVLWVAHRIHRDAIRHATLSIHAQERLIQGLRLDRKDGRIEINNEGLQLAARVEEIPLAAHLDGLRLLLRRPLRLHGTAHGIEAPGVTTELPSKVVAAIELAHDIATLAGRVRIVGAPLLDGRMDQCLAVLELSRGPGETPLRLPLPLPELRTFNARFEWIEAALELLWTMPGSLLGTGPGLAVRAIIHALLTKLDPTYHDHDPLVALSASAPTEVLSWGELVAHLRSGMSAMGGGAVESLESSATREAPPGPVGLWLRTGLTLLAAPEYGIGNAESAELLAALQKAFAEVSHVDHRGTSRSLWSVMQAEAKAARRSALERACRDARRADTPISLEAELTALTESIQQLAGESHPWFELVDPPASSREDSAEQTAAILEYLRGIPLPPPRAPTVPPMPSLDAYVERIWTRHVLLHSAAPHLLPLVEGLMRRLTAPRSVARLTQDQTVTVAEIWTDLTRAHGAELGGAVIAESPRRLRVTTLHERRMDEPRRVLPVLRGWDLEPHTFTVMVKSPSGRPPVDAVTDLVGRLVWDLASDGHLQARRLTADHGHGVVKVYVETSGPTRSSVAWPMMRFQALFDFELFDEQWRECVDEAFTLHEGMEAPTELVSERLAQDYVRLLRELTFFRKTTARSAAVTVEAALRQIRKNPWGVLLDSLSDQKRPHSNDGPTFSGERWEAFVAWRERVPLLACPESGLSPKACDRILQATLSRTQDRSALLRQLKQHRDERLKEIGSAIRKSVRDDPSYQDHPWYKLVESVAS